MTDEFIRHHADTPPEPGEMRFVRGSKNILAHLSDDMWWTVHRYFDGTIPLPLYVAVLRLRVIARNWRDRRWRDDIAKQNKLIDATYFDEDVYEADSGHARLAAAIAAAIGTYLGARADAVRVRQIALILSTPMPGVSYA